MQRFLHRFIETIETAPLTLATFAAAFFALIIARLTVENTLGLFQERSFFFFFFEFTHTFLFFLCSYLLLLPVIRYAGKIDFKKAANVLLFGFLIILTPPLIDTFIFRGAHFWSFYEFDGLIGLFHRFFTLFGDTPEMGITYGVRVEVVLVTLGLGFYTYLKSKLLVKSLFVALLTYTVLFVLGTFPSWLTLMMLAFQKSLLAINGNDVAGLFLSPETILSRELTDFRSVLNFKMSIIYAALALLLTGILLFREFPKYFFALLRNARFPQMVYHGGLLLLGMLLAAFFSQTSFEFAPFQIVGVIVLLVAVECAWLASVLINDMNDTNIDALTNKNRPLIQHTIPGELYRTYAALFFISSLLLSGIVSFSAMMILLSYQALAWLYSVPPFRLKRFPVIATLLAAAAGMGVLVAGYLSYSPKSDVHDMPLSILVFLFVAYMLTLPLKDFKDIAGDKKDGVFTIPVLLGETLGKQVIGSLMFLLYVASPFVLNAKILFFPALVFGSLAFFTLQKSTSVETSNFSFRKLPGILLVIAILYGLTITYLLF